MRNTVKTVDIDAPPEKVFAVSCDVERWPEWTPTMTSVHPMQSGSFAPGSRVVLSFGLSGFIAPLISRLYGGLIERYTTTESQGLKKRCESAAT